LQAGADLVELAGCEIDALLLDLCAFLLGVGALAYSLELAPELTDVPGEVGQLASDHRRVVLVRHLSAENSTHPFKELLVCLSPYAKELPPKTWEDEGATRESDDVPWHPRRMMPSPHSICHRVSADGSWRAV